MCLNLAENMSRCSVLRLHSTMFDLSLNLSLKTILPFLLEITSRLARRVRQLVIIKLFAREFALADFVLVFVRRDAVLCDAITMAVFDRLGDVGSVGRFVAVPWFGGIRRVRGGRRGSRSRGCGCGCGGGGLCGGGGVVECCGADGGGCGEPRVS
jgi:hypothetical protein